MRGPGKIGRPARRVNAEGQLVLAEPYRWDPVVSTASTEELRQVAVQLSTFGTYGSYAQACARDELDRRAPRTASLCFDVKKGWQPIMG